MYNIRRTTSRLAILFLLLAMVVLAIAGCGSGSASGYPTSNSTSAQPVTSDSQPTDSVSSSESASPVDQGTTVSGRVVYRDTDQPYAGAWVEFKNLLGENAHTTTDADGYYSLTLPPGVYTASAGGDRPDANEIFEVTGRPDNAVTVPPSTTINFVVSTY